MKSKIAALILCLALLIRLQSQSFSPITLSYYLPELEYDPAVTTPKAFLGYEVGERHASHDQLYYYMKTLASQSKRIKLVEYARSFEHRPLICLIVTSEKNQANLESLRQKHLELYDPAVSDRARLEETPLVLYQGYSIHGNEPSGANAALAMAYYLAAARGEEVEKLLDKTIILFDPCFNPDGVQRFSSWVNAHRSEAMVTDPSTREFNEPWPRGRTNHYWFDLNRDWMPQQLPESRGRVNLYHQWKPNILTDHHEMGSNATFFFMPGEPTRVNPNTPKLNQELTREIGRYHSESLNSIGSLYYTREGYDDYYYGKGSTYPDANGAVGILFEQASSRGHAQSTANGVLTFPFTIRNQVRAAFSTYKAAVEMHDKLLAYQRDFYKNALEDAAKDPVKGYVFSAGRDRSRMNHFIDILLANQIKVHALKRSFKSFKPEEAYVVPAGQNQYRLIKGMFEKRNRFEDSLFYDISAWSYLLAFNLEHLELGAADGISSLLGEAVNTLPVLKSQLTGSSDYAYALEWESYYAPAALYRLLQERVRVRLIHEDFEISTPAGNKKFRRGTLLIPVQDQPIGKEALLAKLGELASRYKVEIHPLNTGLAVSGVDLGSPSSTVLSSPKVAMIVGDGVDANDAGEVWHLLDQRMAMPLALADMAGLNNFNFQDYNTLILVDGQYNGMGAAATGKLKTWAAAGGNIVAMGRAIGWLAAQGMSAAVVKPNQSSFEIKSGETPMRAYAEASADAGTDLVSGAIFNTYFDETHPLSYGYSGKNLPLFRSNRIYLEIPKNAYAAPFRYTSDPLLSGYITKTNLDQLKNSAAVLVSGTGAGKVICIPDNPNFRAFWYGTNKLFLNCIFFAPAISGMTVQRAE
ncbi:MAG TPA: M14 family zinc carboxypeptidase [Saprospiraceae bacterium]|nr:M14 family zinc carboxypeptidase [Saprospiraceae bacterium]